ncbi:1-phosphatidylinositol 4,5-bisphosphate phosphodiesterase eta-2-like [Salvelinus namaycush]|uniref:Phosphoinositide phospholipase C n=1 Tax=Salvelinus namaycush TaxID=8040 RepID=A0A8U1ERW1_SALNM|nr:1-phosphatidylinositol 4,5-bisphosphate phosphodiesterase eta-2-like [Salvelinus namaycush]
MLYLHHSRKKTMKLTRALSDLVKYTKSVGVSDIEKQAASFSWQVSSLSETKAHQIMQQKAATFIHFNQRQLSRVYPSSYRVDSSNFNPQPFWNAGCHLVALNYQSEGRVLQLNRAKFNSNGNCGYILKPSCMCEGAFNPMIEDQFPGQMKKQLVLKIISGQQLPKPKDSMLGDRGEIIDPFVEVEIIGLPVDCCKEQTRVVDDNGFNPMWEETLVFTLHMPELALVRFLVWDHDPIGQDFIGQRTIAFNSMIPGYRHVYLEGMEAASIFVHVSVHDITGKVGSKGSDDGFSPTGPFCFISVHGDHPPLTLYMVTTPLMLYMVTIPPHAVHGDHPPLMLYMVTIPPHAVHGDHPPLTLYMVTTPLMLYLVTKILSNISPNNPQGSSGRRARRDLVSVSGGGGGGVGAASEPVFHRSRRSLVSPPTPSPSREPSPGLLRVKRLGYMEEGPVWLGGEREGHKTPNHAVGLQRMKRIDAELQAQPGGRPSRRRRALNYDPITHDPELLVQHILHYLPQ